jgi:hypothetical protein
MLLAELIDLISAETAEADGADILSTVAGPDTLESSSSVLKPLQAG